MIAFFTSEWSNVEQQNHIRLEFDDVFFVFILLSGRAASWVVALGRPARLFSASEGREWADSPAAGRQGRVLTSCVAARLPRFPCSVVPSQLFNLLVSPFWPMFSKGPKRLTFYFRVFWATEPVFNHSSGQRAFPKGMWPSGSLLPASVIGARSTRSHEAPEEATLKHQETELGHTPAGFI